MKLKAALKSLFLLVPAVAQVTSTASPRSTTSFTPFTLLHQETIFSAARR